MLVVQAERPERRRVAASFAAVGVGQIAAKLLTHATAYAMFLNVIGTVVMVAIASGSERSGWACRTEVVLTVIAVGAFGTWVAFLL